jgi:hypothetical protein
VTTIKHLTALIDASSLGTRSARAARTSVTAAEGDALAISEKFRDRADTRTYRPVSGSIPGRKKRKDKTMAKGHHRSAVSGKFVKASTAARNPKTTVTERGANHSSGTHHRSAITGKFVKGSTAARHPNTTVT